MEWTRLGGRCFSAECIVRFWVVAARDQMTPTARLLMPGVLALHMYENTNPPASKKTTKKRNEETWQLKMITQKSMRMSKERRRKKALLFSYPLPAQKVRPPTWREDI